MAAHWAAQWRVVRAGAISPSPAGIGGRSWLKNNVDSPTAAPCNLYIREAGAPVRTRMSRLRWGCPLVCITFSPSAAAEHLAAAAVVRERLHDGDALLKGLLRVGRRRQEHRDSSWRGGAVRAHTRAPRGPRRCARTSVFSFFLFHSLRSYCPGDNIDLLRCLVRMIFLIYDCGGRYSGLMFDHAGAATTGAVTGITVTVTDASEAPPQVCVRVCVCVGGG